MQDETFPARFNGEEVEVALDPARAGVRFGRFETTKISGRSSADAEIFTLTISRGGHSFEVNVAAIPTGLLRNPGVKDIYFASVAVDWER
jgi:hypothetical protein